mgnify:CR=1 FL=1
MNRVKERNQIVVSFLEKVGVCFQGLIYRRMAETTRHRDDIHAGVNQERRMRMTQIVDADRRNAGRLDRSREDPLQRGYAERLLLAEDKRISMIQERSDDGSRPGIQGDRALTRVDLQRQKAAHRRFRYRRKHL